MIADICLKKCKNRSVRLLIKFVFLFSASLLLFGCSNTRHLAEGELLYTGAEIEIESSADIDNKSSLRSELENVLTPEPNNSFLGLRTGLWFYNLAGEVEKEKGFRHWMKTKLGEPPVLYDNVSKEENKSMLRNRLYNNGFFKPEISVSEKLKNKKISLDYNIALEVPYRINKLFFPQADSGIRADIVSLQEESLLKPGERYNLDKLKNERDRIDEGLKNRGYYYFNDDYLIFKADTNPGYHKVDIYLELKEKTPRKAKKIFYINDIFLYPDYSLQQDSASVCGDTLAVGGITCISSTANFKPRYLNRAVVFEPGKPYSLDKHDRTLTRLMDMGVFKFVNLKFRERDSAGKSMLDVHIYLTKKKKKSIRAELQGVSKSNNYVGPNFNLNFKNRNLLKGAELLSVNLNASYETQISREFKDLYTYEFGAETSISFPRFMTPFNIVHKSSRYIPHTDFTVGYSILNRVKYFRIQSISASYGFRWKETRTKSHSLFPVTVTYSKTGKTTDDFKELLQNNPFLRQSFAEQFIIGARYTYTYNDRELQELRNHFFFQGGVDISGNSLYLANKLFEELGTTAKQPYTLFGLPFSQYARFSTDFRFYYTISKNSELANRLYMGVGIPYANAEQLPYVRQFYTGGPNSIRAFHARSLGPGTYEIPHSVRNEVFIDQTGDIILEANTEYRFPIVGVVKGGIFVDAGNIWLLDTRESKPGGVFDFNTFCRQIAVGTGFGIRIDPRFFVLRLDLAFPVRKPYLPQGERWVFDEIQFDMPDWRRNNLVLNIAIGYPF